MKPSPRHYPGRRALVPIWISLFLLCGSSVVLHAAEQPAAPRKYKSSDPRFARANPESLQMVTGSRIPQRTSRLGAVPTTSAHVSIITKEQMARTGSATVGGALSRSMNR